MAILIGLWCIESEKSFYGELVNNAERAINFYPIETATYTVIWDNGKVMVKEASEFLYNVRIILIIIGIVEGIFLLEEIIFGTARVRKVLKPLNEIAETAERLSNMVFDEEKFHSIEDAISKDDKEKLILFHLADNTVERSKILVDTSFDKCGQK